MKRCREKLAQTRKHVDRQTQTDSAGIFLPALPCWRDPNCSWLHRGPPQSARCRLCRPHGGGCCHACLGNRRNSPGWWESGWPPSDIVSQQDEELCVRPATNTRAVSAFAWACGPGRLPFQLHWARFNWQWDHYCKAWRRIKTVNFTPGGVGARPHTSHSE